MLTMTIKAKDLACLHELHHAALGGGMFYAKPYRVNGQIVGAEGTLFAVSEGSLVACIMAARDRMIIHACVPCDNADNNDGTLFAYQAPKDFERALRRFADKPLVIALDGSRLEIALPRPNNARGMIWLPMQCVIGRMLSVTRRDSATTVPIEIDVLLEALRRVPHGQPGDLLAIHPSNTGVVLDYRVNGIAYEERCSTKDERECSGDPFLCSTRRVATLARVLKSLRKRGQAIRTQMSASRIAIWNEAVTVQFFADRHPSEWVRQSLPKPTEDGAEVSLSMHRPVADYPKGAGKWIRQLVRKALANNESIQTTWFLTRTIVAVRLDCGLQTSIEIPCACVSWLLEDDQVCLGVNPLTTASILECLEEDAHGSRLTYRDSLLTVRSGSRPHQMTTPVVRVSLEEFEKECQHELPCLLT